MKDEEYWPTLMLLLIGFLLIIAPFVDMPIDKTNLLCIIGGLFLVGVSSSSFIIDQVKKNKGKK